MSHTSTEDSNSGHMSPNQHAMPTYKSSIPTYIGFRVNRYGPWMTSTVVGLTGITLVPEAQKRLTLEAVSTTEQRASTDPSNRPVPVGSRGNGTYHCRPTPTRKNTT